MLARKLSLMLGLSDTQTKAILSIVLGATSAILLVAFPDKAWIPLLAGALVAVASIIDPNPTHA